MVRSSKNGCELISDSVREIIEKTFTGADNLLKWWQRLLTGQEKEENLDKKWSWWLGKCLNLIRFFEELSAVCQVSTFSLLQFVVYTARLFRTSKCGKILVIDAFACVFLAHFLFLPLLFWRFVMCYCNVLECTLWQHRFLSHEKVASKKVHCKAFIN